MKLKFKITVKNGPKIVAEFEGQREIDTSDGTITVADVHDKVLECEQHLEKLTGLRFHIEQVG